jgi:excisionase family DNA binding protein
LEKLLLTVAETAEALSLSPNLVYELIRQGEIPAVRLGKRKLGIPRKELERVLTDKRVSNTEEDPDEL